MLTCIVINLQVFTLESDTDTPSLERMYFYFWEMLIFAGMVRVSLSITLILSVTDIAQTGLMCLAGRCGRPIGSASGCHSYSDPQV